MRSQPVTAVRRAAVPWIVLPVGLCLAGAPAAAWAENDAPPPARRAAPRAMLRSADAGAAAKRLQSRCTRCHDADGSGRSSRDKLREIPDFSNHKWQASRTDSELLVSVLDGKGSHMPGFRGNIEDDDARAWWPRSGRSTRPRRRGGRTPPRATSSAASASCKRSWMI